MSGSVKDRQQSTSPSPAEVPVTFPNQGAYSEAVALAESLGYPDWQLLEAVDCYGLAVTLRYLQREAERRRKELN